MLRIVVPVSPLNQGKSRLASVLAPAERSLLVQRMLRHVLEVAERVAPTYVISRDPAALACASRPLIERGVGLNQALEQAASELGGDAPILVLSVDLPLVSEHDLRVMMARLQDAEVVAAPDARGLGTNALLLATPGLITYQFGEASLAAHREAARRQGAKFATCERPGLAHDVDWPSDLAAIPVCRRTATG